MNDKDLFNILQRVCMSTACSLICIKCGGLQKIKKAIRKISNGYKKEKIEYRKDIVERIRQDFKKCPVDLMGLTCNYEPIVETILKKAEKIGGKKKHANFNRT